MPDSNTGIIVDGVQSRYLTPVEVVESVLQGLAGEKVILVTVTLPMQEEPLDFMAFSGSEEA